MKIGLIDVDSHNFPNLALMKISTYHKDKGDQVSWYDNLVALVEPYDIVYMSKVFTDLYTPDYIYEVYVDKVIKGGYGYNNYELPFGDYEITFPDYSIYYDIYPQFRKTAFGYLTRGCPRNCDFCMVGKYEGLKNRTVCELENFYNPETHKEIKLLDPNLFANKNSVELLNKLANTSAWIDITQGFDIRLLTKEEAIEINKMKIKVLHFAWDNMDNITEKLLKEKRSWFKFGFRKMMVYVLTNFNTTFEEDLYRIYKLRDMGYNPYVMIYDKPNAQQKTKWVQRWVNNKIIWQSGSAETYEDYCMNFKGR